MTLTAASSPKAMERGARLGSGKKTKRGFHTVLVNVDVYDTEHS